jgi:hypothetical protein
MNHKKFASLTVIFLLLGVYVYIFETGPAKDESPGTIKVEKAIDFDAEEVLEVKIGKEGQLVLLKRFEGQWRIVEPVDGGVSNNRVRDLLTFFDVGIVRVIEPNCSQFELYGLENPRYEFGVKEKGEDAFQTLLIGEDAPGNLSCYARVEGQKKVLLIGIRYRQEFDRAFTDFSQTVGP